MYKILSLFDGLGLQAAAVGILRTGLDIDSNETFDAVKPVCSSIMNAFMESTTVDIQSFYKSRHVELTTATSQSVIAQKNFTVTVQPTIICIRGLGT